MSPKFKNIKVFEKLLKPVKRFWRILFPTSSTSSVNQTEEPAINPNPTDVPAAQLPDNDVSRSAPSGAALGFSRKLATGVATASKQPALNPNSTDIPAAQLPDNEAPRSAPPDTALGFSGKVVTGATTATKQPTLNLNPADVPAAQLPDNEAPRSAPSDNALGFSGKVAAGRITTTKQSGHTERPIVAQTPDTFEPTPKQQAAPFTRNVADQVWGGLKAFAGVLSSCGAEFGPLKAAIDVLVVSVSTFEAKRVTQQEYNSLRDTLDWYFHDLAARFGETIPSGMRPSIVNLARGLEHEIEFVRRKQNRHTGEGYAQAEEDLDEIMKCYRRIQNLLERLALNANVNVWMLMDEQATNYRLDKLTPSHAAWYNSKESKDIHRDECTPDTRIEVLERFKVWRDDNAVPKIYWLNGMAGTGKTTLSYTLCKQLVAENRLAANFFCSRLYETCRDAQLILPTIAYQLANFSYPFRYALSQILDRHPDVHTREMKEQFENLLLTPLREIQLSFPENLIIVIEALDECKNPAAVGELLDLLLSHMGDLPIKFFLTSRPEPEIRQRMCQRSGERERFELHLHDLDKSLVQDDIRRYLEVGLKRAKISPEDLQTLVERAGNLFIYAATIVRFVGDFEFSRSFKRLQQVLGAPTLSKGSDTEMNGLYSLILDHAINDPRLEKEEKDEMELVLRTVICALEPMTANALSTLLGLSRDSVDVAVGPLRSVLNFQQADEGISALHKSFSDYLFNPDRAGAFYCDAAKHNQVIAQYCFRLIKTSQPSFNICRLKSSFVFDKDVSHMSETVKQHISGGLLYVCRYWGAHAELAEDSQHFLDDVYDVLSERLLLWMEVLNLTGYLQPGGVDLLSRVTELIKRFPTNQHFKPLLELSTDASLFARKLASSPASQSTPHIYISALRFWPTERPVSAHYSKHIQYSALDTRRSDKSNILLPVYYTMNGGVFCSVFSSDGLSGASCSEDGRIYLWDTKSGETIDPPLKGHNGAVYSIGWSPSNQYIVSGSEDCTVRIWDTQSKKLLIDPLQGHTAAVCSVSYSPDGRRIASGSEDHTVRVWDAVTGLMRDPLVGHTAAVHSVSYSPDGRQIVSGSADHTVRVWDAETGAPAGVLLVGHTAAVHSVSYSPDGNRVVSGSEDHTVRVWDAGTGAPVLDPLVGHAAAVRSVSFSPDTRRIVSGSEDHSVRVWDAVTGALLLGPLVGHTAAVHSVSYSPDGIHIVSASEDRKVHIWDPVVGSIDATPLGSYTTVHCVKCIRATDCDSSSPSQEISRTWDTKQGRLISSENGRQTTANDHTKIVRQQGMPLGGRPDNSSRPPCPMCRGSFRQSPGNRFVENILAAAGGEHIGICETSSSENPDSLAPVPSKASSSASNVSTSMCCSWAFDKEGWVVTCSSERLLWVPLHVRNRIQHPIDSSSIPTEETLLIDLEALLVGEKWALCWRGS